MNFTEDDKQVITELALLSGLDENKVIQLFEAYLIYFSINYPEKKSNRIPLLGNFFIRYKEDKETENGKEAILDSFFSPSDQIRRLVGQLHDIEHSGNYTELDTFKILKQKLNRDFKLSIDDKDFLE